MKSLLTLLILLMSFAGFGQLQSGLKPEEARDMIMLCNSFTYLDLYGTDRDIIPYAYKKVYTSPTLGMDNKFQVYTKGKRGFINFRGSTAKKISWMENLHSAMIPAEGTIKIHGESHHYKYGNDAASGVHSGYALGIAYMEDELVKQVRFLNSQGIYDIFITGHSQGGALAILARAFFEHSDRISKRNRFKVYTFAQPMSGNFEFAREYNKTYCEPGMSYSFVNPADMVPTMPMSYNDTSFLKDKLVSYVTGQEEFDKNAFIREGLMALFGDKLKPTAAKFGHAVDKQIKEELGNIELPEPTGEINFSQVGNQNKLLPPEYPLELKDSSILEDTAFLAQHPRDENGIFEHKGVYKKVTMAQHHKPYNYYTGILRKYFPRAYEAIDPKSFGL